MTYLTTRQIAKFLGVKRTDAVTRLIDLGALPCERRRKSRTRVRYFPTDEEFRSYLEAHDPALVAQWDVFHAELITTNNTKAA